jgi:hypothetical protein
MIVSARNRLTSLVLFATFLVLSTPSTAQQITSPMEEFGFNIGDDYNLANYAQFETYWHKLAEESPRMVLEEIGPTAEGRTQLMAIITSPENHANLGRYQDIARRLTRAEGLTDEEARSLAQEGRAIVWIDGGLHATEVLGAHQLIETVYQLVSMTDEETLRFLNDVIVLAVHANPDGMELVSNWYMREPVPENRSSSGIPRLYHKYIGHDNNRDFFMASQPETENMARIMFREWFPQIVYNHHQTGPAGTVMFAPPFRDPFNYNFDPLIPLGVEMVGAAMHSRFVAEGKPGTTMRSGASYSTWWNGGLRTTVYFHNMIGLLTETIGNPTPIEIPLISSRQLPRNDLPYPIRPQVWHFRQSIDYSVTANRAVLDHASRYRETLLFNIYLMGRNAIDRGSRDHWTVHPERIEALNAAASQGQGVQSQQQGRRFRGFPPSYYDEVLHDPAARDPRGYIIPSDQADFPTATKFVNALIKNGIKIEQATGDFEVAGKQYPAGSYVVHAAQAFRPHIMDMFEPQDHPNDFAYPGGPPIAPYDNAGWTLALQMGVEFDRVFDGFDGPFEEIEGYATPLAGAVANADGAAGFMLSHSVNDGFIATNRLMKNGEDVYWLRQEVQANGKTYPAGTVYINAKASTLGQLEQMASELGLDFDGVPSAPASDALKMRTVKVGLWDRYGGSMPSGWARWVLEQFEFQYELAFPQDLNEGNLLDKYDVLVFVPGAIPLADPRAGQRSGRFGGGSPDLSSIPEEYRGRLGRVSVDTTVQRLSDFLRNGGTIITIGSSTAMAQHANVPVGNHLLGEDGRPLSNDDYFVPGSILEVAVDNTVPVAWGLDERIQVSFSRNPVFRLEPDAQGVTPVAWFDTANPLSSGWAWGQEHLKDGVAIIDAKVGNGSLYLFGPEILRRSQPHGTYKFLFNGIYLAGTEEVRLGEAPGGQ